MTNYFLKRLFQSILVMLIVAFVSFSLFNFVGDPVHNMVGQEASTEKREEIREKVRAGGGVGGAEEVLSLIHI